MISARSVNCITNEMWSTLSGSKGSVVEIYEEFVCSTVCLKADARKDARKATGTDWLH
jgi:hypothetical protein